jgi:hypothetical protein
MLHRFYGTEHRTLVKRFGEAIGVAHFEKESPCEEAEGEYYSMGGYLPILEEYRDVSRMHAIPRQGAYNEHVARQDGWGHAPR